jgi:26S proteasome regulatory subunit (ATPase 3-interacting protein)
MEQFLIRIVPGKQIVYHAIQDPADEATPEELAEIDREIERLRGEVGSAKEHEKALKVELAALGARVPTGELHDQVRGLEAKRQQLLEQLALLRDGSRKARMVTVEEQQRVEREWKKWQRQAIVRKRICRELWERCTEVLPEGVKSKAELWESLGLEGQL